MEAPLISNLLNAGVGGLILIALFYFWKLKSVDQESLLTRIDKIVDRHLAAEESNRKQVADLSETNHTLFDCRAPSSPLPLHHHHPRTP
jgi:hypothetical protein